MATSVRPTARPEPLSVCTGSTFLRLEGLEVGARRDLAIRILRGQPHFEVVGLRAREAHVAGAEQHRAVRERQALQELARKLGLRNTTFVGQVDPSQMFGLYDRADVYLNAPNLDNMPNSIIEAFAAGLPVVTTDAGGIPYIVADEVNGLLSPCGDPEALAANALRLLNDGALARRISMRARRDVETHYTWPAVHAAWRRAYGVSASEAVSSASA